MSIKCEKEDSNVHIEDNTKENIDTNSAPVAIAAVASIEVENVELYKLDSDQPVTLKCSTKSINSDNDLAIHTPADVIGIESPAKVLKAENISESGEVTEEIVEKSPDRSILILYIDEHTEDKESTKSTRSIELSLKSPNAETRCNIDNNMEIQSPVNAKGIESPTKVPEVENLSESGEKFEEIVDKLPDHSILTVDIVKHTENKESAKLTRSIELSVKSPTGEKSFSSDNNMEIQTAADVIDIESLVKFQETENISEGGEETEEIVDKLPDHNILTVAIDEHTENKESAKTTRSIELSLKSPTAETRFNSDNNMEIQSPVDVIGIELPIKVPEVENLSESGERTEEIVDKSPDHNILTVTIDEHTENKESAKTTKSIDLSLKSPTAETRFNSYNNMEIQSPVDVIGIELPIKVPEVENLSESGERTEEIVHKSPDHSILTMDIDDHTENKESTKSTRSIKLSLKSPTAEKLMNSDSNVAIQTAADVIDIEPPTNVPEAENPSENVENTKEIVDKSPDRSIVTVDIVEHTENEESGKSTRSIELSSKDGSSSSSDQIFCYSLEKLKKDLATLYSDINCGENLETLSPISPISQSTISNFSMHDHSNTSYATETDVTFTSDSQDHKYDQNDDTKEECELSDNVCILSNFDILLIDAQESWDEMFNQVKENNYQMSTDPLNRYKYSMEIEYDLTQGNKDREVFVFSDYMMLPQLELSRRLYTYKQDADSDETINSLNSYDSSNDEWAHTYKTLKYIDNLSISSGKSTKRFLEQQLVSMNKLKLHEGNLSKTNKSRDHKNTDKIQSNSDLIAQLSEGVNSLASYQISLTESERKTWMP